MIINNVTKDIPAWYDRIEEPVRALVFLLRNNGFNTESSCGHDMYIQIQYIPDGDIQDLYNLIYNYLAEKQKPIDFKITLHLTVKNGHQYSFYQVDFKTAE